MDPFVTKQGRLYKDLAGPEADGEADWDFYMWGWVGDPDPMSLLSFFVTEEIETTINDCFYSRPEYDQLFKDQQRATDVATRKGQIAQMQQMFYDDACYHILYYDSELHAMRTDRFTGWTNQPPKPGRRFRIRYPGTVALEPVRSPHGAEVSATPGASGSARPDRNDGAFGGARNPGGANLHADPPRGLISSRLVGGFLLMRGDKTRKEE